MNKTRLGFAFCGSFCTHQKVMRELRDLSGEYDIYPIMSEISACTDTRFGTAEAFVRDVEQVAGRRAIRTVSEAEPIGPKAMLDILLIAPCTGNTIAKLAQGITDSAVTMAAKAHLRNGRSVVIAMASNDGLSAGAKNIGELLNRKNYYFVPFGQDDPQRKPCSLTADFSLIAPTLAAALEGRQLQPVLRGKA